MSVQGIVFVLNGKSVEGKPCINREIKSLELTIYLYLCYDEHESLSSCNTTFYLSLSVVCRPLPPHHFNPAFLTAFTQPQTYEDRT